MGRSTAVLMSFAVAVALALPTSVAAQGRSRSSGPSDASAPETAGGSSEGPAAVPRVAVPPNSPRTAPSTQPSSPDNRSTASAAGSADRPSTPQAAGTTIRQANVGSDAESGRIANTRIRGARAIEGVARARVGTANPDVWWYPVLWRDYAGSPFVYRGYRSFDPWRYGLNTWIRQRYGSWYQPYWYGYWSYPYLYGATGAGRDRNAEGPASAQDGIDHGSLRLRIDPGTARVYVDGALAGIVDEFDGLSHHLELTAGVHQIELRADGYEPYTMEVDVEANRTRTARASLREVD